MKILTLRYGWIDFVIRDLYIDGDYEYIETIYNDENAPRYIFEPLVFKLLNTNRIDIIQDSSGKYFWSMI